MGPMSKKEYFKAIVLRYKKASRREKSHILDEYCTNCDYNRKYAVRKLASFKLRRRPGKAKGKPGRSSKYDKPKILAPLKTIWLSSGLPCSKRLKAMLPIWLGFYERRFGYLGSEDRTTLLDISPATIDRVLQTVRIRYRGKGRCTTKPGLILKHHIPIQTECWDERKPGFLEADTVAHCGTSMEGMFAFTLDAVDIATGWTEQRAVWGKGEAGVLKQIKDIEESLPFPLLGFDCDNGPEFLNHHLWTYCRDRKEPVRFTRSRPYHSDDNAHVEQKNWTHVRQWIGYGRFEDPEIVKLLNDLYTTEWRLFHNFFLPSMKLLEKKRIGSKIVKKHDSPKTPYQRVLESYHIKPKTKKLLKEQFRNLNPFELQEAIKQKINKIHSLARLPRL